MSDPECRECREYPGVNHRNHWNDTRDPWPNEDWVDPEQRRAQEAAEKARMRREGQQAKAAARRAQRATERQLSMQDPEPVYLVPEDASAWDSTTLYDWSAVPGRLLALAQLAQETDHPYDGRGLSETTWGQMDPDLIEDATIAAILWAWNEHMIQGRAVTAHMFRMHFRDQDEPDRRFRATRDYIDKNPSTGFLVLRYFGEKKRTYNLVVPINDRGQIIITGLPADVAKSWAECRALSIALAKRQAEQQAKRQSA